jgi:cbb3-type cytochrome oxidase maturation protein
MDILYLLIPMSTVLVLGIIGVFAWALHGGQFDDLEQHGEQIFDHDFVARVKPGMSVDAKAHPGFHPGYERGEQPNIHP